MHGAFDICSYPLLLFAVFHWTDVPSLVSGDYLVMFDPHAKYVPGATDVARVSSFVFCLHVTVQLCVLFVFLIIMNY